MLKPSWSIRHGTVLRAAITVVLAARMTPMGGLQSNNSVQTSRSQRTSWRTDSCSFGSKRNIFPRSSSFLRSRNSFMLRTCATSCSTKTKRKWSTAPDRSTLMTHSSRSSIASWKSPRKHFWFWGELRIRRRVVLWSWDIREPVTSASTGLLSRTKPRMILIWSSCCRDLWTLANKNWQRKCRTRWTNRALLTMMVLLGTRCSSQTTTFIS